MYSYIHVYTYPFKRYIPCRSELPSKLQRTENNCSDWSMEVKLPTLRKLWQNDDGPTNQLTTDYPLPVKIDAVFLTHWSASILSLFCDYETSLYLSPPRRAALAILKVRVHEPEMGFLQGFWGAHDARLSRQTNLPGAVKTAKPPTVRPRSVWRLAICLKPTYSLTPPRRPFLSPSASLSLWSVLPASWLYRWSCILNLLNTKNTRWMTDGRIMSFSTIIFLAVAAL